MCHNLEIVVAAIFAFLVAVNGHPRPDFSSWMDKLPSFEVKVGHTGLSVSTGPSRNDIFWMIGCVAVGLGALILSAIAIWFCIQKYCSRREESRTTRVQEVSLTSRFGVSPYIINGSSNTPLMTPAILSSHFRPSAPSYEIPKNFPTRPERGFKTHAVVPPNPSKFQESVVPFRSTN